MANSFGEFLAERRKEKGLTQKELANKLFVSESTVSKWEQNRANPDISVLPNLSEILGVSEHELITASIDINQREVNKSAKKWKHLTFGWNLFFAICYGITLLVCFICNLAVSHKLSWFWIVFSSLLLSASFTNLSGYVKKYRLLVLSISPLFCLILLLGVCCLFVKGNWFMVSTIPILLAFITVFLPIYIKVYNFPKLIKQHCALMCVVIDYLGMLIMFYVIEGFYFSITSNGKKWATAIAFPISFYFFVVVIAFVLIIRYAKINAFLKTAVLLLISALVYPFMQIYVYEILFKVLGQEKPITYMPNFYRWDDLYINNNINFIVVLSLFAIATAFFAVGMIKKKHKKIR